MHFPRSLNHTSSEPLINGPLVLAPKHLLGGEDSLCLMEQFRPGEWKIFSNAPLRKVAPLKKKLVPPCTLTESKSTLWGKPISPASRSA